MANTDYLMDMENEALASWGKGIITGKKRTLNKDWIKHIGKYVDYGCKTQKARNLIWNRISGWEDRIKPMAIELCVKEYIEWVNNGGGDEWFQE